ncbi:hypothetical protein [Methylobacterium sp. 77]|uniref:hypothetical protein n=1 Tax=Methylobacterium sp. 77 TaxID=1101192 RepID=UPI00036242A5|nr:hypothetical protein [Methylobacterium sp. 77]
MTRAQRLLILIDEVEPFPDTLLRSLVDAEARGEPADEGDPFELLSMRIATRPALAGLVVIASATPIECDP